MQIRLNIIRTVELLSFACLYVVPYPFEVDWIFPGSERRNLVFCSVPSLRIFFFTRTLLRHTTRLLGPFLIRYRSLRSLPPLIRFVLHLGSVLRQAQTKIGKADK